MSRFKERDDLPTGINYDIIDNGWDSYINYTGTSIRDDLYLELENRTDELISLYGEEIIDGLKELYDMYEGFVVYDMDRTDPIDLERERVTEILQEGSYSPKLSIYSDFQEQPLEREQVVETTKQQDLLDNKIISESEDEELIFVSFEVEDFEDGDEDEFFNSLKPSAESETTALKPSLVIRKKHGRLVESCLSYKAQWGKFILSDQGIDTIKSRLIGYDQNLLAWGFKAFRAGYHLDWNLRFLDNYFPEYKEFLYNLKIGRVVKEVKVKDKVRGRRLRRLLGLQYLRSMGNFGMRVPPGRDVSRFKIMVAVLFMVGNVLRKFKRLKQFMVLNETVCLLNDIPAGEIDDEHSDYCHYSLTFI
jgi:hypothetical protein